MDLPTAIEKYWSHALAVAGGVFAAWKAWREMREKKRGDEIAEAAARHAAKVDLTELAQEVAGEVVNMLREEVARLREQVIAVQNELRDLRREHVRLMADKDAKIALLEGRERQLLAEIAILKRQLEDAKLTPRAGLHFSEVPAGHEPLADACVTEPLP